VSLPQGVKDNGGAATQGSSIEVETDD